MNLKSFFEDIYIDASLLIAALIYTGLEWQTDVAHILGGSLALISFVLWIIARINLGQAFAMKAEAKQLVTSGIYSKIRNPMYVFSLLTVLGIVIALGNIYLYPIVLLLILVQIHRIRREEKILETKFGQKYMEYKSQTWF